MKVCRLFSLPGLAFLGLAVAAGSCRRGGVPDAAPVGLNSSGIAIGNNTDIAISGGLFAFRVSEAQQFNTNLNGTASLGLHADTDASDKVLVLFHINNQIATNVAIAGSDGGNIIFCGNLIAFTVNELSEGNADLNGDGAATDVDVLYLFNTLDGSRINTSKTVIKNSLVGDARLIAFKLPSGNLGWIRINTPSALFDSGTVLIASAVAGSDFQVGNNWIVFLDSSGIPKAIDTVAAGTPISLGGGLATKQGSLHLVGDLAVYLQAEGASDRNGDSDTADFFPTVSDVAQETQGGSATASLTIEADSAHFQVSDNRVAFLRKESDSGAGGNDLNGDGDTTDSVLFWLDLSDPSNPHSTLLAAREMVLAGENIAITVPELDQQGASGSGFDGDLNGDGDVGADRVVFFLDVSNSPASVENFEIDGEGLSLSDFILAFGANESLQGQDLNGDGVVDAGTLVAQAIDLRFDLRRNMGWQADTLYAVGRRVFFRVPESQVGVGDLNHDGDLSDSLVAFYDINDISGNLTSGVVLKSGFFGVAADDSLFVFLSEESEANADINGDGDKLDRVVRYLRF